MKKIKSILLIALAMLQITAFSQVSSKEEMVKRIFEVLKNKDEEGFIKLYPDAATIKQLVWKLMAPQLESDTSGQMKMTLQGELDAITDSVIGAKVREDFKRYIAKGEKIGIDWSKTVFMSYTSDSIFEKKDEFPISKLSGKIYFDYNGKEYFLAFGDIVRLEKGWYGCEITKLDEKSKENEASSWNDDVQLQMAIAADSTRYADSAAASVKSPPVQKQRQPVKKQPAKSNTQSSAKKP